MLDPVNDLRRLLTDTVLGAPDLVLEVPAAALGRALRALENALAAALRSNVSFQPRGGSP